MKNTSLRVGVRTDPQGRFVFILNSNENGIKAIFIARRAKSSYETSICDFFPYKSQM